MRGLIRRVGCNVEQWGRYGRRGECKGRSRAFELVACNENAGCGSCNVAKIAARNRVKAVAEVIQVDFGAQRGGGGIEGDVDRSTHIPAAQR